MSILKNKKYSFLDDYSEGCHPHILRALTETNFLQHKAYGQDEYSKEARLKIHSHINNVDAKIFFIAGGTLTNIISLSSCLRSHEAIVTASTGHINKHETGAIEATGHKVISVKSVNGKLTVEDVQQVLLDYSLAPHMVKPKLVYISNATEIGTVYTKLELEKLSKFCQKENLFLFMDGARLGSALCSHKSTLSLEDISHLTDMFWIGGTKVGALLGEAIVINTPKLAEDFEFHIKQRGALLAKGRVLGIQFNELFTDNLLFELAQISNDHAKRLSEAILSKGYELSSELESNQLFPIFPNKLIQKLREHFDFYQWGEVDADHTLIRLVTSWATEQTEVNKFIGML